ncbi:MAG: cytochrome c biogenesis protein CcsA [Saprospiraceae bacterium]|nr:cytochrome c biogenesis protein CcsA [Saprospiraceae bacterium]
MEQSTGKSTFRLAAWKWAAMGILIYVFIAGWIVPLKPGIIKVSPEKASAGELIVLDVTGYNTSFLADSAHLRAWLRLTGDTVLAAQHVQAFDDRNLSASFYIPSAFPFRQEAYPLSLVLDHHQDGTSVLPNAVFITPAAVQDTADLKLWYQHKIENVHTKAGMQYPFRNILAETIRNTYFHVPMWFSMIILFSVSAWYSLKYYKKGDIDFDRKSVAFIKVGLVFGALGLMTGMLWAKNTWNAYWSWDVKQNMSAICLLIYAALMVMRSSVEDDMQKARLTAGYNMFAFVLVIPLLFIIPRMTDSLHPGNGGNPALGGEDLDNTMRMVFYPAVIGFILLGLWISQLVYRTDKLKGIL